MIHPSTEERQRKPAELPMKATSHLRHRSEFLKREIRSFVNDKQLLR